MQDIEPQLARLREIESRIAVFEARVAELLGRMERLAARGLNTGVLLQTYDTRLRALDTLRLRRAALLAMLQRTDAPQAAGEPDAERPSAHGHIGYRVLAAKPTRPHLLAPAELRKSALLFIDAAVESFEIAGADPDAWQSTYLSRAIGSAALGLWLVAIAQTEQAIVHPDHRGEHSPFPEGLAPANLRWLRRAVDHLWLS